MTAAADAWLHLPAVSLPPGASLALTECRIVALSTEEWLDLEDLGMGDHARRFDPRRNAFLHVELPSAGDAPGLSDEAREVLVEHRDQVSLALLLTWRQALPHVRDSFGYVRWRDTRATLEMNGVAEREWLLGVIDHDTLTLAGEAAERFQRLHGWIRRVGAGADTPMLTRLTEVVRASFVPGSELADLVCHFTAVHEDIVNPRADRPLGKTFAARMTRLHCDDPAGAAQFEKFFGAIYHARSEVLHGGSGADALARLGGFVPDGDAGRILRGQAIAALERILAWAVRRGKRGAALDDLADELAAAVAGGEPAWAALRAALETGGP